MGLFGFSTETSAAADFTPIIKYDARSGRMFRVDRTNTGNGFVSDPVDITMSFKAIVDFENVETGWMDFPVGSAPSFVLLPLAQVSNGTPLPPKPSEKHKNGIRVLLKLNKTSGGEKPVRELAGTARSFLAGVEEVYGEYLREKQKYPSQLPVIVLASTVPVKSGSGVQSSTNYQPKFKLDGWAPRPDDLIHLRPSAAPVEPLKPTAPSTGAQTVPPPNKMAEPQTSDDDFG